jgi:hypothetical protein
MSVPTFDPQAHLFSLPAVTGQLFAPDDRFRLFTEIIYPRLVEARPELVACYCPDKGCPAVEPGFDPTVLVRFRERLIRHEKAAAVFTTILEGLQEAGLVAWQSKQRPDSMFVTGRRARMSTLECVRETRRLALGELETSAAAFGKPAW